MHFQIDTVMVTHNAGTWEAKAGRLEDEGQVGLQIKILSQQPTEDKQADHTSPCH